MADNDERTDDSWGNTDSLCVFCDCPMKAHDRIPRRRIVICRGCGSECELTDESAGAWRTQLPAQSRR